MSTDTEHDVNPSANETDGAGDEPRELTREEQLNATIAAAQAELADEVTKRVTAEAAERLANAKELVAAVKGATAALVKAGNDADATVESIFEAVGPVGNALNELHAHTAPAKAPKAGTGDRAARNGSMRPDLQRFIKATWDKGATEFLSDTGWQQLGGFASSGAIHNAVRDHLMPRGFVVASPDAPGRYHYNPAYEGPDTF